VCYLRGGQRATHWNLRRWSRSGRAGLWHIENVERSASCWFLSEGLGGVMRDVVAVHDVIVPVALAWSECSTLEAESSLPSSSLGCIFGQGKLTGVVVPGPEKVDCLDICGGSKRETELDSCHCGGCVFENGLDERKIIS